MNHYILDDEQWADLVQLVREDELNNFVAPHGATREDIMSSLISVDLDGDTATAADDTTWDITYPWSVRRMKARA